MPSQNFKSVWDAVEDSPIEAANLRLRSRLMMGLAKRIEDDGLSQAGAAELFGVSQPRVSDLVRGKIDAFSLDALVNMAARAGLEVRLQLRRAA